MNTSKPTWVVIALLCVAALSWPSPAAAQTVPFKVMITQLVQLDTGVDPVIGMIGDYYARVTINGIEQSNNGACDDESSTGLLVPFELFKYFSAISECSARTPWTFVQQVPVGQPVTVKIHIGDSDTVFDDDADAKPGAGDDITLTVGNSGQWGGDVLWPQTCSRPNNDLGSRNVNVCFQAGFDSDDDGLLDVWETSGVDTDNDGTIDLDLSTIGANPQRKDVFLEADYLRAVDHSHGPLQAAVSQIVTAFANAPVGNPDGTTGVQLHVDVGALYGAGAITSINGASGVTGSYGDFGGGNIIAEAGNETIEAFFEPKGDVVDFAALKALNFNPQRQFVFRYTIFGHQTNSRAAVKDCTSGEASTTRRDFMVTLGGVGADNSACWGTDGNGFSVGSVSQQAGTLMHEMGHTLGLFHGGDADVNNKPNYLSVMNYSFQSCSVPLSTGLLPGGCDYSRLVSGALLPDLNETDLDECVGIGGGLGFGRVDWNGNGIFEGVSQCGGIIVNTRADTNNDGVCITAGSNGVLQSAAASDDSVKNNGINDGPNRVCNSTKPTPPPPNDDVQATASGNTPSQPDVLHSFDDWQQVTPSLIAFSSGFGTGSADVDQEPDPKTIRESREHLSKMMVPGVIVDATGPATGKPGDVLTFTTKITNTGKGPALSAVLQEKAPDAVVQTTEIGTVAVGSEVLRSRTFTVPAGACPGGLSDPGASLSFKDFSGQQLLAADTAPLQILDVAAPTVNVVLSRDRLWPPNHQLEEVTATLTVTDNCDTAPAIVLVSITSNEPAAGFLGNGDKSPDFTDAATGTDDRTFSLRSERGTGKGNTGRVYTVTYRATDKSGNTTLRTATVTVPTSNSQK